MSPTQAPNIARAATNGMVMSSSMEDLLSFISTVPGSPSPGVPGTDGLHPRFAYCLSFLVNTAFTLVKTVSTKMICAINSTYFILIVPRRRVALSAPGPSGTSGKYRGNEGPTPVKIAALASCHRLRPGITLTVICRALWPTLHWSIFPAALSCKAQTVISFLLY